MQLYPMSANIVYTPHYWFPPHSDIQVVLRTDQTLHILTEELGCQLRPSRGLRQRRLVDEDIKGK